MLCDKEAEGVVMSFFVLFALAIGLSMDAFAVAICLGLSFAFLQVNIVPAVLFMHTPRTLVISIMR